MTTLEAAPELDARAKELEAHFAHWEKIKDLIDSMIDIMLTNLNCHFIVRSCGLLCGHRIMVRWLFSLQPERDD